MKPKAVWFDGRINRREYFARANVCLLLILLALAPVFLRVVSVGRIVTPRCVPEELFPVPLIVIVCMISFGYLLPASVRRLHDFGRSGWWLFGLVALNNLLAPMLGKGGVFIWKTVVNLLLLFWPGTKGPNEYGEVPRFEARKLMGRRFAMVLVVMYALEAALCGWIIAERCTQEEATKIPIPQTEVDGMLANLARTNEIGRELEFSECRVDGFRLDAKIPCVTVVALDPESHRGGVRFSVPVGAEKVGLHELCGLHVGQKLRAVRAVVCDKGDEGEELEGLTAGVWMRLQGFTTDEPTVALPPFDGAAITGDELVALLRAHKNRLSPIQIDELQRRLSGRRLTFTGMGLRSYGGANNEINSADFAFSDIGLQLSVELKPVTQKQFDSLKLKTLTGTVAEKSANDSYGDRVLRLTDGVAR